jgi:hypothetical protein
MRYYWNQASRPLRAGVRPGRSSLRASDSNLQGKLMSNLVHAAITTALVGLGLVAMDASAQVSGTSRSANAPAETSLARAPATLSSKQRGQMAGEFVRKWGVYAQSVYGVPVKVWSSRMVPSLVAAEPANLRRALQRTTFEGAMAELNGTGHRTSDAAVIDQLAAAKPGGSAPPPPAMMLGRELVYTPVMPCRIVDTRNTVEGTIGSKRTRGFSAVNQSSFVAQGGSDSDCGTSGVNAAAVAVNLTAVAPAAAGHATAYTSGPSMPPKQESVSYGVRTNASNEIVLAMPPVLGSNDFTLYSSADAHYVVDVVGFYSPAPPPRSASTLECTSTFASETVSANSIFDIQIPRCPASYTVTGAGCRTPGFNQANWAINGIFRSGSSVNTYCSGQNVTAGNITVEGTAQCCRVSAATP